MERTLSARNALGGRGWNVEREVLLNESAVGEPELLASCYRRAVELAAARGARRVAFPAISTGAYGYPLTAAARVSIDTVRAALAANPAIEEARFWLFDRAAYDAFAQALAASPD